MFDEKDHIGHIVYNSLKRNPDFICQIDAATGESETNESVLRRSVHLARCLRKLGLAPGDILALAGRNHLDNFIPYYAAVMNGMPIVGVDPLLKSEEVKEILKLTEPKIAFCEPENYSNYVEVVEDLGLDTRIVTFGRDEHSLTHLAENYPDNTPIEEFDVAEIDMEKIYAWLISTGGTSGTLKMAAIRHDVWKQKMKELFTMYLANTTSQAKNNNENKPSARISLSLSSIHWISGLFTIASSPVTQETRIHTSAPATTEHVIDIINKYKPTSTMLPPNLATLLLKNKKPCDLSCFKSIILSGGKVHSDLLVSLRERVPKAIVFQAYGQTENLGIVLAPSVTGPIDNCGRPIPPVPVKLVDPETGKDITEPHVTGELWTKGVGFSCYYKNPEETANAFSEDGWFKTGDLLYRDEDDNYYFVERLKMLIKYKSYHILPPELEAVIRQHPGVLDVSVTSVPNDEDQEHAVACVVREPGAAVTAQEIKDLVANKLSETKQLRGGVVFLEELPLTPAGKVARGKLRQLVMNMHRE